MNTRRTFLKTASLAAVTTGLMDWEILARAAASGLLIIRDAKIIRVRDRKNGKTDTYLEITSESGLKGYAGPLLKEQVAAFPPNLRQQLAGRDAADPQKLNFNKGYPGVQVIPHGHHVLAASNCVASQSETLCPMLEFLFQSRAEFQHCQTRPLMAEVGYFAMAEEPGLGPTLDLARLELEPASG